MTARELLGKYPEQTFGQINIQRNYKYVEGCSTYWKGSTLIQKTCNHADSTCEIEDKGWDFYLNHSCDEWDIGDLEEAKKFQENLNNAIQYGEANP